MVSLPKLRYYGRLRRVTRQGTMVYTLPNKEDRELFACRSGRMETTNTWEWYINNGFQFLRDVPKKRKALLSKLPPIGTWVPLSEIQKLWKTCGGDKKLYDRGYRRLKKKYAEEARRRAA
jgi:hypothetical protein